MGSVVVGGKGGVSELVGHTGGVSGKKHYLRDTFTSR